MGREVLYSLTLADIYLKQGSKYKALEIYEYLLKKNPEKEEIRVRLENLKKELERKGALSSIKEVMRKKIW